MTYSFVHFKKYMKDIEETQQSRLNISVFSFLTYSNKSYALPTYYAIDHFYCVNTSYPMDNSLSGRRGPARQTSEKDVLCLHRQVGP